MRSGRVTHFFLLSTSKGIAVLSCFTLIWLLSVGNSCKTCIISVDLGEALVTLLPVQQMHYIFNRVAESIEDIERYHKISFATPSMSVTIKYMFSKKIVLRLQECNGFTYLQLSRGFKNLSLFKDMPFEYDPPHRFYQFFCFFDFINKIENFHCIHI